MDPGGGGEPPGVEAVAGAPGGAKDTPNHPSCEPRRSPNLELDSVGTDQGLASDTDTTEEGSVFSSKLDADPSRQPRRDPLIALQFAAEDAAAGDRITHLKQAALREAKREGLHLVVAPGTKTGFKGVHFKPSKSKPYQATACGNRKNQHLGHFVTAEEAALCYARHIGREAAAMAAEKQLAAPPEPVTPAAKQAVATAAAEGLELVRVPSANSGYKGVIYLPHRNKPYQARASCGGGRSEHLGYFDTVEEAALCYSRHERRAAAIAALCDTGMVSSAGAGMPSRSHIHKLAKVSPSPREGSASAMSAESALLQAKAEGLHLLRACTKSGYKGVAHNATSKSHPFVAKTPLATSASRSHHLGCFATAEEAALCCARHLKDHVASEPSFFEHASGHRRGREALNIDVSRYVRPRAAHVAHDAAGAPLEATQAQVQAAAAAGRMPQLAMPYMPQMMMPGGMDGMYGMYGVPGLSAGGGLSAAGGLPPAGGLPGMLPYSALEPYSMPTMLRGAMPSAGGMMPTMPTMPTMPHWPMMPQAAQQPSLSGAGSLPGTVHPMTSSTLAAPAAAVAAGGQAPLPTATAWCSAPPPAAAPAPATATPGLSGPQHHQASTGHHEASTGTAVSAPASAAAMRPPQLTQLMPQLGHGVQDAGMASMAELLSWQQHQHQHAGGGPLGMPIARALPHSMLPTMMAGLPVATAHAVSSPQLPLQVGAPAAAAINFPSAAAQPPLAVTAHRVGPQQASLPFKMPTSTRPFAGGSANATPSPW